MNVKLPPANKKPQARKRFLVQKPFCHSTLKSERNNFKPQNNLLFRSTSCFGYSNLTSKVIKMCEQI